jgi:hypothetical protein
MLTYAVRLTPLLGGGSVVDLPGAADVQYGIEAVTVNWADPLINYRPVLAALGMNAPIEQFRLSNGRFSIWTPIYGVIPVRVEIDETNPWEGVIRTINFCAVGQLANYNWSQQAEAFRIVFYRTDYFASPEASNRVYVCREGLS